MFEIFAYLMIGIVVSGVLWMLAWLFGSGDNDGIQIGFVIWVVIISFLSWVGHMALIGMGVI